MAGKVILCQIDRADEPYYIDSVDLCVYSIEELCYFADRNLPLVDDDFFDESLLRWLEDELHLDRLTATMDRIRNEDPDHQTEGMLLALNAACGWLYSGGQEEFRERVREFESLSGPEKLRRKADRLVACGKYSRAISVYKGIIRKIGENGKENRELLGKVYHNLGVTYARFFQMEEAMECMKHAYSVLRSGDMLQDYLYCVYAARGREEYEKILGELKVDDDMRRRMDHEIDGLDVQKRPVNLDETLNQWVKEYHREAGL